MAVIPQNTPGTKTDFDAPIFVDACKSMLFVTPKCDKECVFRIIPEITEHGQVVPMCRTYDATGHDWSNLIIEDVCNNNGIMGKFTGSVIPARPGDNSGLPDTSIGEPDLPFRGLYIRLKGRMNKNTIPLEHQAAVGQIMNRGANRPAPLSPSKTLIFQAWILCNDGTWLVDGNRQPAPRRGFVMLKPSHAQAIRQLLIEAFTAGLDLFNPDTGACFRTSGFPAGTFPGQQLATGTVTLCNMQGTPLSFRGHTPPATPAGRPPVSYLEYNQQTASPLPPTFWQGPSAFMPSNKVIRRYTLQELLAKQLSCFGPAVCQLAFPNEYGAPMINAGPQGQPMAPQGPAFGQQPQMGQPPAQAGWPQQPQAPQAPQQPQQPQAPAFGQVPMQPQAPQQPAFGQVPGQPAPQMPQQPAFQPQQQTFAPAPAQAPQQPAFGQQPQQAPQQPAFGQHPQQPAPQAPAPVAPAANAFGAQPLQQVMNPGQPAQMPQTQAPAPVVQTSDAAALQAAFAQTLGQQIPKV